MYTYLALILSLQGNPMCLNLMLFLRTTLSTRAKQKIKLKSNQIATYQFTTNSWNRTTHKTPENDQPTPERKVGEAITKIPLRKKCDLV